MRVTRTMTLALALCVASCSGKKEGPEAGPSPETAKKAAISAAPTRNAKLIEFGSFKVGRALTRDGRATGEGSPFGQGEPIHVTMEVYNAPAGSVVKMVVTNLADKKKVDEQQKTPSGEKNEVAFTLPETRTWAQGEYHIDLQLVGGVTTLSRGVHDFKLGPAKQEK